MKQLLSRVKWALQFLIVLSLPTTVYGAESNFVEGLAVASVGSNHYGYIDRTGKWAIEPIFDEAYKFSKGLARVKTDGKYGFIDKAGNWIIEPNFIQAYDFTDGLAPIAFDGKSRFSYIDITGKVVVDGTKIAARGGYESSGSFFEGLASIRLWITDACDGSSCSLIGFIDKSSQLVIGPRFFSVGDFSEGLAFASEPIKNGGGHWGGLFGFVDKTGNWVIEPRFQGVTGFVDGLAQVKIDNKYGFIDKSGKWVIEPKFNFIFGTQFSEGLVRVQTQGRRSKIGFMDKSGKIVIEPAYFEAKDYSEGLAAVQVDGRWGYIDKTGKTVIAPKYRTAENFSEGLAEVVDDHGKGYIDNSGNWAISPETLKNNLSQCKNVRCDSQGAAL